MTPNLFSHSTTRNERSWKDMYVLSRHVRNFLCTHKYYYCTVQQYKTIFKNSKKMFFFENRVYLEFSQQAVDQHAQTRALLRLTRPHPTSAQHGSYGTAEALKRVVLSANMHDGRSCIQPTARRWRLYASQPPKQAGGGSSAL